MKIDERTIKQMSMFGQAPSIFGLCLPSLIESNPNIVVICADQANPAGLDTFRAKYPEHFISVGIAEQNMIGMAAGIAETGYRPVCVAQACFLSMRAYEPIRQFCGYMRFPLILIGISSGFGLTLMGNTHYSLEDIALMRTVHGMSVACPANPMEAVEAFEEALVHDGPVYIRLNGFKETQLSVNIDNNSSVLHEGDDVNIIATGSMVTQSLKVSEILGNSGIKARVYNAKTVAPLHEEALRSEASLIVTIEEHRPIGGLGDAAAAKIASQDKIRLLKIGVEPAFPKPGSYLFLLEQSGLMPEQIAERIKNELNKQ